MAKSIEFHREHVLESSLDNVSFLNGYKSYFPSINELLPDNPTVDQVYGLGEHLSDIFKSASTGGQRTQSSLSAGGAAWEALVVWYMNLLCFGTPVLVSKFKKDLIPSIIRDSLAVTAGGSITSTESDVVVFAVDTDQIPDRPEGGEKYEDIEYASAIEPHKNLDVGIVQCKTNWNDTAQIPMAWDIIYSLARAGATTTSATLSAIRIGMRGHTPNSLANFSYAFMTVPTSKPPVITQKKVPVAIERVAHLSGGNYWGHPTGPRVAACINEYFTRNFSKYFAGGVRTHIQNMLNDDPGYVRRFKVFPTNLSNY